MGNFRIYHLAVCCIGLAIAPQLTFAQGDEIQVYDGGLADPGQYNLTLHNNYTPRGIQEPAFDGAIVSDRSFNGVPEWAYGVNDWFEAGLYLPLYSIDKNRGGTLNGFKLRTLFAVPHADERTFVYGINFEYSYNALYWDPQRFTAEIRPIVGWHLRPVDIFFNPNLDTSYNGFGNLEFAPSVRVAYNVNSHWAEAIEEYADLGPLKDFLPAREQSHQLFEVVDYASHSVEVEAGIGYGLTGASDDVTLKLILSHNFN